MGLILTQALQMPFYCCPNPWPSTVRVKILRPALGLPCSYPKEIAMEPLLAYSFALDHEFAVVLLTTQTVYLLWSAQQFPLTPGGDLSGMTRLHSVVVHHGYDCLQSDSFFSTTTPGPFHGELIFFCISPSCVQYPRLYQVNFLESPGIGTQIILALQPHLGRAQSGSCHLVSLGGLFLEVCQVLS